jgi:putative DNA primase/helicase
VTAHQLTEAHQESLEAAAIDVNVALAADVRSVTSADQLPAELSTWSTFDGIAPGIVFPITAPDGRTVPQYRPDTPVELNDGAVRKYLFSKGGVPGVNVHPAIADRLDDDGPVWIVEGTKQTLAAVSVAPDDVLVLGVSGCLGWSVDGAPSPDLCAVPFDGRPVVVMFDADLAANRAVWDAADRLADVLASLGAASVKFVRLPAGKKAGLDDYLSAVPAGRRAATLRRLADSAGKLPRKPAKRLTSSTSSGDGSDGTGRHLFDSGGLMALSAVAEVRKRHHLAVGPDRAVWVYRDGIYHQGDHALISTTRDVIGEQWRRFHHDTILTLLAAELIEEGRVLPPEPFGDLIAVRNGMLNVRTGELVPHDPEHLAYAALSVEWDPTATCPRFDAWLVDRCGTQAEDLLEAVGLVLLPWGQRKTPFLIGPSRSGKGTFLRIIESIVGDDHRSARTLHALTANRFAPADLVGKVLNSAGDLSDRHLDDLSMWKMLTGADAVMAERKFRDAFTFRNSALFVFSANTPPTVSESSRAYAARVRPYLFPWSYEADEDPAVEAGLLEELPGVLVRLVEGVRRWLDRRGYAPVNAAVADLFATQSDPVALFVAQAMIRADGAFTPSNDVVAAYGRWGDNNKRHTLGRNKFVQRADVQLGERRRQHADGSGQTGWHGWILRNDDEWLDDGATYGQVAPSIRSTARSAGSSHLYLTSGSATQEVNDTENHSCNEVGQERAERAEADLTAAEPRPDGRLDLRHRTPEETCERCGDRRRGSFSPLCVQCNNAQDATGPTDTQPVSAPTAAVNTGWLD